MSHIVADRVRDTTTSTSSPFTLSGTAPLKYRSFAAVCAVADTVDAFFRHQTANQWQVAACTYSASNQLTVNRIYSSSAGGAPVTFSAGTIDVVLDVPAEKRAVTGGVSSAVGDTDAVIPPYQGYVFTNGFLTANRTWTLPLANSVPAGWELTVADAAGGVNSVYAAAFYTLTLARAGSDSINDGTSVVLTSTYQIIKLISNGISGWTIVSGSPAQYTTGDLKPTHKVFPDPTWVMWADGTIGDASSGANVLASPATFRLFELYYDWYGATECPLLTSTGTPTTRGAVGTATTAFYTAHCRMTLPKGAGRKMTIAGTGAGLSGRTLGSSFFGAESDTPTIAKLVSHDHDDHIAQPGGTPAVYWNTVGPGGPSDTLSGSRGSSNPVPILDPETIINVMIKL